VKSAFIVVLLLLFSFVLISSLQTNLVKAETYDIIVEVSSPIQNKTYFTNDIPLSFNYSTNITNLPNITEYSVVFCYNLDGEPNFDVFGNPVFWGNTTRIGQFDQPVPSDYNSSIHVPDGNHSLFVLVTFWITPEGRDTFDVNSVSQVVNFTVSAEPTIPEFPSWTILPLFITGCLVVVGFRKKLKAVS
jgi:hypothetical protein